LYLFVRISEVAVLAAIHITSTVSSVGDLWAISSIPAYIVKIFTDWCVIYDCHILSLSIEKLLLRLTMKVMDTNNMLFINVYFLCDVKNGLSPGYSFLL